MVTVGNGVVVALLIIDASTSLLCTATVYGYMTCCYVQLQVCGYDLLLCTATCTYILCMAICIG